MYDSYFAEFIFRRRYLEEKSDKFLALFSEVKRIYTPDTKPGLALASPRAPLAAIQPVSVSVNETYCSVQSPDLFD